MKRVCLRIPVAASHGLLFVASVAIATLLGSAFGHATVVFGMLSLEPNPPPAGTPFRFELTLDDPTGTPVEDAVVIAELTPSPPEESAAEVEPGAEPLVAVRFAETQPGTYQAEATVPTADVYRVFLRDQTFAQEEATQLLTVPIGTGQTVDPIEFLFPATATGGGLSAWLVWLVAIPLLAGIVVTIVVLRSSPASSAAPKGADGVDAAHEPPADRR